MPSFRRPALAVAAVGGVLIGALVVGAVGVFVAGGGGVLAGRRAAAPAAAEAAGALVIGDAVAEVAFADAAVFVDVARRAAAAGLVADGVRGLSVRALEDAGVAAPVVVALRRTSDVVVSARVADATRLRAALTVALPQAGFRLDRRLGRVDAVVDDAGAARALLRVDDDDVLLAIAPTDELGAAALLEATAAGASGRRRAPPAATEVTIAGVGALRAAQGTVAVAGDDIVVEAVVVLDDAFGDLVRGLRAPSPSFACGVEDGAIVAARLPPLSGAVAGAAGVSVDALGLDANDAFDGRVVVALHEPPPGTPVDMQDRATLASLVVAGHPRAGARTGLESSLGVATARATRLVAGRTVHDITAPGRPWRSITAVVDDDAFALGVGASAPVDRVAAGGTCPAAPARLLVVDGRRLRGLVARAMPQLSVLGAALGQPERLALPWPWSALTAVDRLEVDAEPRAATAGGSGDLAAAVTIRVRSPALR